MHITMRDRYSQGKALVMRVASIYENASYDKVAWEMRTCAKQIEVTRCNGCGRWTGVKAFLTCKQRMCPICAMRKSRVIAIQSLEALEYVRQHHDGYTPYLITLTQKNCPWGQLAQEIDRLQEGLGKIRKVRSLQRGIIGSARTIEVTCNYRRKEWHPHVHMIALIRDSDKELGKKKTWVQLWRKLMGLNYVPECDIRELKDDGAVYEVSKYVTKFTDFLDAPDEVVQPRLIEITQALHKRRMQAWTGAWREARKALKQKNAEDMNERELDEHDEKCPDCGGAMYDALMRWTGHRYEDEKPT